MQNYQFKLTPAYCLYNGVAVMEQKGAYIKFISENAEDMLLKKRLEKAFLNHVAAVLREDKADASFKTLPVIEMISGTHEEVRNCVSRLFRETGDRENAQEINERKENGEAAAILLLDSILKDGRENGITDIHIESNTIRIRRSGKLETYAVIQKERISELILRIKLLAGMNVLDKRKSQDGSFVYGKENPLFVRVSVMPVVGDRSENDESVVLRLLDSKRLPLVLEKLGFSDRQLSALNVLGSAANGLLLICGATCSGKSTTAAAILLERIRNEKESLKIVSLEDPPEYVIPGVTQIRIDKKNGTTFSSALESIFRQDPDIIMIGEIRDSESAATALRASMTGHLVIATLHTDSVASSFLRLKDLGCSSEILASVLRGVILQDLEYTDEGPLLYADIAVAKESLPETIKKNGSGADLDKAFLHFSNAREMIGNLGRRISEGLNPRLNYGRRREESL